MNKTEVQKRIENAEAELAAAKAELVKLEIHQVKVGDVLEWQGHKELVIWDVENPGQMITTRKGHTSYHGWCNGRLEPLQSYVNDGRYKFCYNVFDRM